MVVPTGERRIRDTDLGVMISASNDSCKVAPNPSGLQRLPDTRRADSVGKQRQRRVPEQRPQGSEGSRRYRSACIVFGQDHRYVSATGPDDVWRAGNSTGPLRWTPSATGRSLTVRNGRGSLSRIKRLFAFRATRQASCSQRTAWLSGGLPVDVDRSRRHRFRKTRNHRSRSPRGFCRFS